MDEYFARSDAAFHSWIGTARSSHGCCITTPLLNELFGLNSVFSLIVWAVFCRPLRRIHCPKQQEAGTRSGPPLANRVLAWSHADNLMYAMCD
jgi:hypothetical protein